MNNDKHSIWIVDDERLITNPLRRLIRDMSEEIEQRYEILTDTDPQKALESIKKNEMDMALIISDIKMPNLNGLDFLEEVKKLYPLAPRIILTGYADKANAIRALNDLDLFSYVEKPWNDEQLIKLVQNALQRFRQTRMEAMFRRYVPYEVIEEYIDQSDQSILSGKPGEATILFLDIIDFTEISENMDASDVVSLLNAYFTIMVDIVHKHHGILDKFTGDGLMGLFGMPTPSDSPKIDAKNAVLAALDIVQSVVELNAERNNQPLIRVRIGLNSGTVIAGNIGSKQRVNYTAVSDVVNTASRIENAARHIIEDDLSCILISDQTYQLVHQSLQEKVIFEPLEPMKVKGKSEPIFLYKTTGSPNNK